MVDESLGDAAEVFEQTPNQSLRSTTLQMLRCVSSPPGSTLSKNDHARKDASAPPASALPECSARPGPAGHAPASAHHAPAARRARTPTASHSHPHGSPQMSHVIPRHVLQTLKSGRCNSNVFRAYQKLTKINYVRVFGEERLPPAREITAHPHGSPQMSHVIPRHVFQTLKSGRCNSNVFRAYRKLTEGNYVRLFGACAFCPPRGRNSSGGYTHSRSPGTPTPVTPVGAPGNPRPRRDAPFVSTRPGLVQRSQPQYANPLGCSAKTANPGSTTSKPLAL